MKLNQYYSILLRLCAIFSVSIASAQVEISHEWEYEFIESKIQVLPLEHPFQFDDNLVIQGALDNMFIEFERKHISGKETYNWMKVQVRNNTDSKQNFYLGTNQFEQITLWVKIDTIIKGPWISGQNFNLEDKPVKTQGLTFFKVEIEAGGKANLYLKTQNVNASLVPQMTIPLVISNEEHFLDNYQRPSIFNYLFLGALGIMFLFNILLFLTTRIKVYFYYSFYVLFVAVFAIGLIPQIATPLFGHMDINRFPISTAGTLSAAFYVLVVGDILQLKKHYPKAFKLLNILLLIYIIPILTSPFNSLLEVTSLVNFSVALVAFPTIFILGILMLRKNHEPSKYIFAAITFFFVGVMSVVLSFTNVIPSVVFDITVITIYQACIILELALFALAIAVRINEMQDLKIKEELGRKQTAVLTTKNTELSYEKNRAEKALADLKVSQEKLVHSEKMASLGELTAGIAHEIQNPLNFVNNFSDLNVEMIGELVEAVRKGDQDEINELLDYLKSNEDKISHHGRRAEEIVKSMLMHSRVGNGEKISTNLNSLTNEYMRLAYHGLRAKDKSFNAKFDLQLDDKLPAALVVPQEIGRVILNLVNNAFQAVSDSGLKATRGPQYQPEVVIETKFIKATRKNGSERKNDVARIVISDNGTGIDDEIIDKIFNPFFTTKPTGDGTGLGLSMSYDIITKGHDGTLSVKSKAGEGASFIIELPIIKNANT